MLGERLRLTYLSKHSTGMKQISLTDRQLLLFSILGLVVLFSAAALIIGSFTRLYHNYQISRLEQDRNHLQQQLLTVKDKVIVLNDRLAQVEESSDQLRNVANLPPINNDIRKVGIGGPVTYQSLEYLNFNNSTNNTALELSLDLEKLERAIGLEKNSMDEISTELSEQLDRIDHLPSIKPVMGGYVNSPYGFRIHPTVKKRLFHPGVDMPMPKGTPVLATADGKVARIEYNHPEYGRYVLIDHGYGLETKYCHLSKVLVKRGQKIKRWDTIAEVGMSGRTTGYHLHYEVVCGGERQDPEHYFYN